MLIFNRKRDECIKIGDDITIMVTDIKGDKVRIGIECPREMPVHRQEVYDAIRRDGPRVQDTGSTTPPV